MHLKNTPNLIFFRTVLAQAMRATIKARSVSKLFIYLFLIAASSTLISPAAEARPPERWAILIGIDNYFDLAPLTSSSKDAIQFGEILQERCGFNPKNISVVVDQPSQLNRKAMLEVRFKTLRDRIKNFINAAEQGDVQTIIVYYSGHGCAVTGSKGTQASELLLPAIDAAENNGNLINALSKNEIARLLAAADIPEKLLILDCCHAAQANQIPLPGKAIRLSTGKSPSNHSKTKTVANIATDSSFVILAGSAFDQIAGEQVFTKHLVDGLSVIGNAATDSDRSHQIEIDELYRHVRSAMSASGGQTPDMQVISGKASKIALAPVVVQPDPERTARVYVLSNTGSQLPGAQVKLVFSDIDREESITLASSITDKRGKAELRYHFGTTRERNGRFRISVTHRGGQYASSLTNISNFADRPSPADFKITLPSKQQNFRSDRVATPKKQPSPKRVPTPVIEPTFQEVLKAVTKHVEDNPEIPDVCSFQKHYPEYNRLLKQLTRSQKLRLSGTVICFPGQAIWNSDRAFRTNVIRTLTSVGVLNSRTIAAKRNFIGRPEPTFAVAKEAAFGFVERIDADVCGLVEYVDGYKTIMDTLDKREKFEVLPGLAICFPSKAAWDSKPDMRRMFIRVLRESRILDE